MPAPFALALLLLAAPPAATPAPAPAPTARAMQLAREVVDATNGQRMVGELSAGLSQSMAGAIVNGLPADQQSKADVYVQASSEEMQAFAPRLLEQIVTLYAQDFTEAQLSEMLAFYRTPTGKAVVAKVPAITQQLAPFLVQNMPALVRGTVERFCVKSSCTPEQRQALGKMLADGPGK